MQGAECASAKGELQHVSRYGPHFEHREVGKSGKCRGTITPCAPARALPELDVSEDDEHARPHGGEGVENGTPARR